MRSSQPNSAPWKVQEPAVGLVARPLHISVLLQVLRGVDGAAAGAGLVVASSVAGLHSEGPQHGAELRLTEAGPVMGPPLLDREIARGEL